MIMMPVCVCVDRFFHPSGVSLKRIDCFVLQTKSKESGGAERQMSEAIYDGRQRCADGKQVGVVEEAERNRWRGCDIIT